MRRDAGEHGRFLRLFGGIWAGVGSGLAICFLLLSLGVQPSMAIGALLGGAFALSGSLLWLLGRRQREAAESVFRDGVEASGVVVDVFRDLRVRMNGRHPWRVVYELDGPDGRPSRGTATFWDDARPHASVGQRVTALYHPHKPSRTVLWTRLAGADGLLSQEAQRLERVVEAGEAGSVVRVGDSADAASLVRFEEPEEESLARDDLRPTRRRE